MSFEELAEDVEVTIAQARSRSAGAGRPLDGRHGGADHAAAPAGRLCAPPCCPAPARRSAIRPATSRRSSSPTASRRSMPARPWPISRRDAADGIMGPNADPAGRALFIEHHARRAGRRPIARRCDASSRFDERANLPDISVPVLCLAARARPQRAAAGDGEMAAQDSRRPLLCLPGVGHLPNLEAPRGLRCRDLQFPVMPRRKALTGSRRMNRSMTSITHDRDAPIFAPDAFRLGDEEAALIDKARRFGARVLAPRAAQHDRDATFPIENFRDMHREGLLAHLHPARRRAGSAPSYRTYCLAAAELGRYCGATALSWNMHVCSTLWTGALADDLEMTAAERAEHNARRAVHYRRIVERRRDLFAAVLRRRRGGRRRGRLRHRGEAGRRRLPRQRQEDLRLALGRRRLLRRAVHRARRRRSRPAAATRSISRFPANAPGVSRGRRLGPARHARHRLAHAAVQGRVRARGASC